MQNHLKNSTSLLHKAYETPIICIELIHLEHGIAAGSATVTPLNNSSQVRDEWEIGTDVVGDQLW